MARAKKKRKTTKRRLHQEPIVREIARLLDTGTPTKFRWSSACRRGLRAAMCLKGEKWARADSMAGQIVTLALHRIGAGHRPSWAMGQREPVEREFYVCAACGGRLDQHHLEYCSEHCRQALWYRRSRSAERRDDDARERARRILLTGGAEQPKPPSERRCRHCGELFAVLASFPRQQFCSKSCGSSSRRLDIRDCEICNKPFTARTGEQRYCGSAECVAAVNRRKSEAHRARRRVWHEKMCVICDKTFSARWRLKVYCGPECTAESHRRKERERRQERLTCEAVPVEVPPMAKAA